MNIRMIAVDLDGTLLNSQQTVSSEDYAAIERATQQGIEVVISTGRAIDECREVLRKLPRLHYANCCTGAYLADLYEKKPVCRRSMSAEDGRRLYEILEQFDCLICFFADGVIHNDQGQMDRFAHYFPPKMRELFDSAHVYVPDLARFVKEFTGSVDKFYVAFPTLEERNRAFAAVKNLPYYVTGAGFVDFEIMAAGVDKKAGLEDLANHLGITAAQVAAIGDSENDLPALRYSQLPIVMENGDERIKAEAAWIAPDNDHSGVAWAIDRILEENQR